MKINVLYHNLNHLDLEVPDVQTLEELQELITQFGSILCKYNGSDFIVNFAWIQSIAEVS